MCNKVPLVGMACEVSAKVRWTRAGILLQALCEGCQIAAVDIHVRPVVISYPGVNERVDEFAALRTDGVQTGQVSRWRPNAAGEQAFEFRPVAAADAVVERLAEKIQIRPGGHQGVDTFLAVAGVGVADRRDQTPPAPPVGPVKSPVY